MYYFYTIIFILYNFIQFGLSQVTNEQEGIDVLLNEGSILHLNFTDLGRNDYESCGETGQCESQGKPKLDLVCNIVNETQGNTFKQYIHATSKIKLSADYAGEWQCTFSLTYTTGQMKNPDVKNYTAIFKLSIIKVEKITDPKWIYIGSAIATLAVLIIVAQTMCILHFKKKARRTRMQSLQSSASVDSPDKAVRYTQMPGQIKMEERNKIPRESGIYEVLDNCPIPKPEPPPIDTLPRPGKTNCESQQTSLPRKPLPPPTAKKPVINKNIDTLKDGTLSASSLERIKSRKPQPLPMNDPEMYEVMTTPDILKKPESGLSRALPGKAQLPTHAVPVFPAGNNIPVLPSMIAAAQLKPVSVNKSNKPIVPSNKKQTISEPKKTAPLVMNAVKKTQPAPPVFRKPPAPLPIQTIPDNNGSISSDEEEWTYEPLSQYNQYNIYDNVPR